MSYLHIWPSRGVKREYFVWKHSNPTCMPFMRGIQGWPVDFRQKVEWRGQRYHHIHYTSYWCFSTNCTSFPCRWGGGHSIYRYFFISQNKMYETETCGLRWKIMKTNTTKYSYETSCCATIGYGANDPKLHVEINMTWDNTWNMKHNN